MVRATVDAITELHRRVSEVDGETRGLLIGSVSPSEISIDRVREMGSEPRPGTGAIVGLYRSHPGGAELLHKEDIELAAWVRGVELIAIVEPASPGSSVCHAFIKGVHGAWTHGGAFSLPGMEQVVQPLPAEPPPARLRLRRLPPWWAVAAVPLLVAGFTWIAFRSPRPTTAPGQSQTLIESRADRGLEMRLERNPTGDMKIQWNRQAPAIHTAVGGWLRIREGQRERELDLDVDQLRSGNLLYLGASGADVIFRLEVFDTNGRVTSESVRLIGGLAVPVRPPMQIRAAGADASAASGTPGGGVPAVPEPRKTLQVPLSNAVQPSPLSLPAPEVASSGPGLAPPPLTRNPALPAPPSRPAAQAPAGTAPASQSQPAADRIEPARATRQFRPVVPSNIRSMLSEDTTVTVLVKVNEEGRVVSAEPQAATGVVGRMLSGLSTDAARAWRFEPARRNGIPVSSTVSLVFRFSK